MNLLIDADYIVYKCCAACETEIDYGEDVIFVTSNYSDAYKAVTRDISNIQNQFGNFAKPILFFSDSKNFRKKISPDYKGHRNRRKPLGYKRLVNHCRDNYKFVLREGLEADDSLGIDGTKFPSTDNIIVSPDKDLRQIPGVLWNLTDDVEEITKEQGDDWHLIQTLAGDPTDGYSGCPGIGVKKATAIIDKKDFKWESVCQTFRERGLSDDDALLNARLAKILQHKDYNYDTQKPILWNP